MFQKVFRISMILVTIGALACSSKKHEASDEGHEVSGETWSEMDDFHMIMAESFHPFKDSSNLEPAIKNSSAMAAAAERWASASIPEKVDKEETKAKLQQLKSAASAFDDLVKAGSPQEIGNSLTEMHDLFHELQEEWYGAAGDHDEHH
jgi:hypothetical protein